MSGTIEVEACGKVNVILEVLGERPDGYHELASVVQSVALCDSLRFVRGSQMELGLVPPLQPISDNLILAAASLLQEAAGCGLGAHVVCRKRIPVAAGLGGGSADAAATLVALNRLWSLGIATSDLSRLAGKLGSDVPFFLTGGTALVTGRGEQVEPLADLPRRWIVILVPLLRIEGKTARMYAMLADEDFSSGSRARVAAGALQAGTEGQWPVPYNALQRVAALAFPEVSRALRDMARVASDNPSLAGSGPAVFAAFASRDEATAAAERLRVLGHAPILTRTLSRSEVRDRAGAALA